MQVYIYCADIYCEDCGEAIIREMIGNGELPHDIVNYDPGDSDDYPQGPFPDGGGEADCPQHCGSGPDCVNAIEFPDGVRVGCFLENPLTSDGVRYVRDAVREGGEVAELWAQFYEEELDALACDNQFIP